MQQRSRAARSNADTAVREIPYTVLHVITKSHGIITSRLHRNGELQPFVPNTELITYFSIVRRFALECLLHAK